MFLPSPFTSLVRCSSLPTPSQDYQHGSSSAGGTIDHFCERPIRDVYYLWGLAGGDVEVEFKKNGMIQMKPPISNLPW